MKKSFLGIMFVSAVFLGCAGCMGRGEPLKTGPDSYLLQDQYAFGWPDDARNRIMRQAGDVCAKEGKNLVIHTVEAHMNGLYPAANISFSCSHDQYSGPLKNMGPTQTVIIKKE